MKFVNILGFLIVMIICSCNQQPTKNKLRIEDNPNQQTQKSGLQIEYGPNLGITHTDTSGTKHFYVHITATVTNDTTVPIQLHGALATEYNFPGFCSDDKFTVFLVPEELTPDTATIYNDILNGQHDYLNTPLDAPAVLNKTLNPGEFCVVTVGTLTQIPSNCAPVPRAVFSHDNIELYQTCDSQINEAISTEPQFEIGVKLEYYYKRKFISPEDGCAVIPFGKISYPGH